MIRIALERVELDGRFLWRATLTDSKRSGSIVVLDDDAREAVSTAARVKRYSNRLRRQRRSRAN